MKLMFTFFFLKFKEQKPLSLVMHEREGGQTIIDIDVENLHKI